MERVSQLFRLIRANVGFSLMVSCMLLCPAPALASELGRDWTQATSAVVWGRRWAHNAVVYSGKMWIMGGYDHFGDVWYSTDGTSWTRTIEGSRATDYNEYVAVVFNGRIWTLGADQRMVCYSTDGRTWTRVLPDAPWLPRSYPGAVVHNGRIWVLGGANWLRWPPVYYNDVWSSADGIHWTSVTLRAQWGPRAGHHAVSFDGRLWVIGGSDLSGVFPNAWCSLDGRTWTRATSGAPWGYRSGQAVAAVAKRIWVIAGALETLSGFARTLARRLVLP